jgi:hypothetical protein
MQKHSFARTFRAKIKEGLEQGGASTPNPKNITLVEPFAWSSSMAMILIVNPLQQPLCNELVVGDDKGFCFIF